MTTDLIVPESKDILQEMKQALANINIDWTKLAEKIWDLLDAKTLNNKWDEMCDNKVQLDTLKLVLQLNWVKWIWNQTQIAIFNKIWKDEKLEY